MRTMIRATVLISTLLLALVQFQQAAAQPFGAGNVMVSLRNGTVREYTPTGTLVRTLTTGRTGELTGSAFDASGKFYQTAGFTGGDVLHWDANGVFQGTFGSGYLGHPESIIFDSDGNVYVGAADANVIKKFTSTGTPLATYTVATQRRGTDWVNLAGDGHTMFYTSEGTAVKRYDIASLTQLSDFSTAGGVLYAFRILPDGGLVASNTVNCIRLNSSGVLTQTYLPGSSLLFALNLDPDGTSFWTAEYFSGVVKRVDLTTGATLATINVGQGVSGLCVNGERVIGGCVGNIPPAFVPPSPSCGSTVSATVGTPMSFTMAASDGNATNVVALSVSGLPSGTTFPIPTPANPVSSLFSWTPAVGDVGPHVVLFRAADNCTTVTCTLTISVTGGDLTPPSCQITGVIPGPPKQILVTVQDNGSGLTSVVPVTLTNATLSVAPFTVGTTSPVLVTATKINQALAATVVLRATDVAGNSVVCDPVYTTISADVPEAFALAANYPNPFNPTTTIHFNIAKSFAGGLVTLKVYDLLGREVKTLINDPMQGGQFSVQWDGTREDGQLVPSGTYLYRLIAGEFVSTKKMTLMK